MNAQETIATSSGDNRARDEPYLRTARVAVPNAALSQKIRTEHAALHE